MGTKYYKRDQVFAIKVFGNLTAVGTDKKGRICCECSCGKRATYQSGSLLDGNITCCGHTFDEGMEKLNISHDTEFRDHLLYKINEQLKGDKND